ncbi:hypothetical protein AR158_c811L [Paramecium bursaria Chlorella virus AR158]|uniref:hypothetical protein n=1 Tax=Paramecium bursaria Chlorella virus AR158 TaxID=380598 RepID=UPI00015AA92F|nr:hypothetical protein AR158_c811L [Paramecium bursaria Chlorella virus AR158]ABU44356.1 hypothetical protein AR158_c811L [Paramecium bursaria Chlorella virus AR158]
MVDEETLDRLEDRSVRRTRCNTLDRFDDIEHEGLIAHKQILDGRHSRYYVGIDTPDACDIYTHTNSVILK